MDSTSNGHPAIDRLHETLPAVPSAADYFVALEETLIRQSDFHRVFDAKLLRVRHELKLPLSQPTSLENVPQEHEKAFREAYVNAAREVGQLFLDNNRIGDAWAYYRTIGEPEPVRSAIEKVSIPREPDEAFDELMNVALYEGAHMVRGLEFLLKTHGTCNTVTAFSQLQQQMTPDERRAAGAMMVRTIYDELQHALRRDVEARMPVLSPGASIRELITGRDWLFADGNYHIDVSHLHSTVGFARALHREDPELQLAVELCDYGSQLAPQLQYPGDVPFDDYYTANRHFLKALAGDGINDGLTYFKERLASEPDEPDQQLIAFVLLDLANRVERTEEALKETATLVSRLEDPNGFSFIQLCIDHGLTDVLAQAATANDDVVAYTIAQLSTES